MLARDEAIERAGAIMTAFADRTGLTSDRPAQRYLWTDAFAVCNFLGLGRATGDASHTELARRLVDQVHHVLGRHRADDRRTGWISGLDEAEGEANPTRGGLRIGKKLPERAPGQPLDERLEWDRDGQYFHYLTKWMHALDQVARATRDPRYNVWARELAVTAHAAFARAARASGGRGLAWKMSIDLSRPLVPSMGQHDPLDGYITCIQLATTASRLASAEGPTLEEAVNDLAAMIDGAELRTADPLGLGGLLADAARVSQLVQQVGFPDRRLADDLVALAQQGLAVYARLGELQQPASRRLAFRELGLAIGLAALALVPEPRRPAPEADLGPAIVSFWLDPAHQQERTWSEHRDINEVMLATSLLPDGFLVLS